MLRWFRRKRKPFKVYMNGRYIGRREEYTHEAIAYWAGRSTATRRFALVEDRPNYEGVPRGPYLGR